MTVTEKKTDTWKPKVFKQISDSDEDIIKVKKKKKRVIELSDESVDRDRKVVV
jgi:hypothetical protein